MNQREGHRAAWPTAVALCILLAASAAADERMVVARDGALELPDSTVAPSEERRFAIALAGPGASLRVRAYSVFEAESGSDYALRLWVNGTAVTDAHHPAGSRTHQLVNHPKHHAKVPWYDPTAQAWAVFLDADAVPADRSSPYYCPEATEYVFVFPIGALLRAGDNTVVVRNVGKRPLRLLAEATYRAELSLAGPSPDDRFVPARRAFPPVTAAAARTRFLAMHRWMEHLYNGDGSWGRGYADWPGQPAVTHPLTRFTGYCVLGYLVAGEVEPDPVFRERAAAGLAYLLREQDPSGAFRWYWTVEGKLGDDALYETGIAGRALVAGYEATKDRRYLDASARAAAWELAAPISANANYNLFAVWHLAAHYRASRDGKVLDGAVARARAALRGQTPRGCWSDAHNQRMWYHGIILRGLVELAAALPEAHADRAAIVGAAVRAANHVIRAQRDDGALELHPAQRDPYCGSLVAPALMHGERALGWKLDAVISGINGCPLGVDLADPATPRSAIDDGIVWGAEAWRRAVGR